MHQYQCSALATAALLTAHAEQRAAITNIEGPFMDEDEAARALAAWVFHWSCCLHGQGANRWPDGPAEPGSPSMALATKDKH